MMERARRMQFWGEDENDDSLIVEILEGKKTATVSSAGKYDLAEGEYDDGGYQAGELVEVYDLKGRLRCRVLITAVYPLLFGKIPEKLWRGEACQSAAHFQEVHRQCWPDYDLNDDFELIATHFELVEIINPG